MKNYPLLTIFTPTYNRKEELKKVYSSLLNQSSHDFVWHIIDDGSIDDTEKLVQLWMEEGKLQIIFEKHQNMGKTKTMNRAFKTISTPLWMCLDSDDWLNQSAVKKISNLYTDDVRNNPKICGLIGLRRDNEGNLMQARLIPRHIETVNYLLLRYKMRVSPEYVEVYKSEILKQFNFPEVEREIYFPISYLNNKLSEKYDFQVIHDPIMYMEYQDKGITKNRTKLIIDNPIGYMLFNKQLLEIAPSFKKWIIAGISYNSASILARKRISVDTWSGRFMSILTFPLGVIDYLIRFKLKIRIHSEKTY